jgi:hypothetical protein
VNRADLAWALNAVLPHVGKRPETAVVGLQRDADFQLVAYATDKYTFGAARIPDGPELDVLLPTSEATDLLRFVRPANKKQDVHEVITAARGAELHVGLVDEDGETFDSAVFNTTENSDLTLAYLEGFTDRLAAAPDEFQACVYQPKVFARFAKAGREETDRVQLLPKHISDRNGAALVLIGDHFVGAISGLTYEPVERSVA